MRYSTLFFLLLCTEAFSAAPEELDKLVARWITLEQQHAQIDNQWRLRKPVLQQQLALLASEKQTLTHILEQNKDSKDALTNKRLALSEQQNQLEKGQADAELALQKTDALLRSLEPQLPPPLQAVWERELTVLDSMEGVSERLEKQLYLLSTLRDFNRRVATHQQAMEVAPGVEMLVKQVYLGENLGWYLSPDKRYWGAGQRSASGWQWQHQSESVEPEQISQLLRSIESVADAELVSMPITIQRELP